MRNASLLAILVLAVLALSFGCAGGAGGSSTCDAPQCCAGYYYDADSNSCVQAVAWIPQTMTVLVLMFLVYAILWMVSIGFNMPPLLAWAKNELYQLLATALLVGMTIVMMGVVEQLILFLLIPHQFDPAQSFSTQSFSIANLYLKINFGATMAFYVIFSTLNVALGMLASATLSLAPMRVGITFQPGVFLRPILDTLAIALQGQAIAIVSYQGQIVFLQFIQRTMMAIVLPVGVFLRAFPFTRSAGGALIAVAIGFYVVWPLTYVMANDFLMNHWKQTLDCQNNPGVAACLGGLGELAVAQLNQTIHSVGVLITPEGFGYLGEIFFLLFMLATGKFVPLIVAILLLLLNQVVYLTVILGFVVPMIQLLITFTFIRALAGLMGADINIQALSKIV